jgi:peptide/nickel transport system substrate-binding protein
MKKINGFHAIIGALLVLLFGVLLTKENAFGAATVRATIIGDPINIDPAHLSHTQDRIISQHVHQGLVTFDLTAKPPFPVVPVLAKSYDVSEDAKAITFKLHEGVPFHGGYGELTSEDVAFTLQRHLDKKTASRARSQLNDIAKVQTPDKYTVVVHLKVPSAFSLLRNLAWMNAGHIMSKKAVSKLGDKIARNPIGTGPFYYAQWIPGEKIILKRFDKFWGIPAKIDVIELWVIAEEIVALGALAKGDLDVVPITQRGSYERAKNIKGIRIEESQGGARQYLFYLNHKMKPMNDIRVRRALALALDLKTIAQRVGPLAGYFPSPLSPVVFAATDKFWEYEYNLEKAKQLLKEAGYPNGFDLTIIYYRFGLSEPIVLEAQSYWNKVVNVKLEYVEQAVFKKRLRQYNHHLAFWARARYAPFLFAQCYLKDSAVNHSQHSSPAIDAAIMKAKTATSEANARKYWEEFQKLACEDVFNYWMANGRSLAAVNDRVKNVIIMNTPGLAILENVYIE